MMCGREGMCGRGGCLWQAVLLSQSAAWHITPPPPFL